MTARFTTVLRTRKALVPILGACAAMAAPSLASAATVERTAGNNVFFYAPAGENNDLKVTKVGTDVVFVDAAPVTNAGGCVQDGANKVRCPVADLDRIYIFVDNGTNKVTYSAPYPTHIDGYNAVKNTFAGNGATSHSLLGGPGDDVLTGNGNADYLYGMGGADTLDGGDGPDEIKGGPGNDRLIPRFGADKVWGDADADTVELSKPPSIGVKVTLFDNQQDDGPGSIQNIHSDVENVVGTSGADQITGTSANNHIYGGGSSDRIYGGAGTDRLYGETGPDLLYGQDGTDTLYGGDQPDGVDGGSGDDVLYGIEGDDHVSGGAGEDTLNGGPGRDIIRGGSEADLIAGKADDDVLFGNGGPDLLAGGTGVDTVDYQDATAPVFVDLDGVAFDDGAEGEGDSIGDDVENVLGGSFDDTLTGNGAANVLRGGAGRDTIDGREGPDELFGEAGEDVLKSSDGSADQVDCGADVDSTEADAADALVECEAPDVPVAPLKAGPAVEIRPAKVRLTRAGAARLSVRCSDLAQTRCDGTLILRSKGRRLGSAAFSIPTSATQKVAVKLSRKARRTIKRRGSKATAVVNARDEASEPRTTKRRITIKRR